MVSFLKLNEKYKDKPFKLFLVSLDFPKSVEKSLMPFLEKKKIRRKNRHSKKDKNKYRGQGR